MKPAAAVVAGLAVSAALAASAAPAGADVQCTGADPPNVLAPEVYQVRYNSVVVTTLTQGLKTFNTAVASSDSQRIGPAAGRLSSQISSAPMMYGTQFPFGCYSPAVLANLQQAANALTTSLDAISGAAAGLNGKTSADVPVLVVQIGPQESAYIDAVNAYGAQFGGQPMSKPDDVLQGLPG